MWVSLCEADITTQAVVEQLFVLQQHIYYFSPHCGLLLLQTVTNYPVNKTNSVRLLLTTTTTNSTEDLNIQKLRENKQTIIAPSEVTWLNKSTYPSVTSMGDL